MWLWLRRRIGCIKVGDTLASILFAAPFGAQIVDVVGRRSAGGGGGGARPTAVQIFGAGRPKRQQVARRRRQVVRRVERVDRGQMCWIKCRILAHKCRLLVPVAAVFIIVIVAVLV